METQFNNEEPIKKGLLIDDADYWTKVEYAEYCNETILYKDEKPLSFEQWFLSTQ